MENHSEEFKLYTFPLGPAYIMASLKSKGHDVQCLNLSYENKSLDILLKTIYHKFNFDIVISGGLSTDYNKIVNIIKQVRKFKY
jgi:radical SAM superfamily enzyme YgiQ (UPF0313 family)